MTLALGATPVIAIDDLRKTYSNGRIEFEALRGDPGLAASPFAYAALLHERNPLKRFAK